MAGEAILILESDPAQESRLYDALSQAGYHVYAADSAGSVLKALEATSFPIVLVAAGAAIPIEQFANQVRSLQPDSTLIFSAANVSPALLQEMLRGGAVDIISKPFDVVDVHQRINLALERRRARVARLLEWQLRARTAEDALAKAKSGNSAAANSLGQVAEFADFALNTFLTLARENREMSRAVRQLSNPGAVEPKRAVVTWLAHSDREFSAGVSSLGPRLNLDIAPPMSTGGEILDKMSAGPPDIIVLDSNLPDMPGYLVQQTIHAEHQTVQIIFVDGWGTSVRTVTLVGDDSERVERTMTTVQDLVDVMQIAADRANDTAIGRDYAIEFKERHEEFLRRYASVKNVAASTR